MKHTVNNRTELLLKDRVAELEKERDALSLARDKAEQERKNIALAVVLAKEVIAKTEKERDEARAEVERLKDANDLGKRVILDTCGGLAELVGCKIDPYEPGSGDVLHEAVAKVVKERDAFKKRATEAEAEVNAGRAERAEYARVIRERDDSRRQAVTDREALQAHFDELKSRASAAEQRAEKAEVALQKLEEVVRER